MALERKPEANEQRVAMISQELNSALPHLENHVINYPADSQAHYLLASCLHHTGNFDRAKQHYELALSYGQDEFWVLFNLDRLSKGKELPRASLDELAARLSEYAENGNSLSLVHNGQPRKHESSEDKPKVSILSGNITPSDLSGQEAAVGEDLIASLKSRTGALQGSNAGLSEALLDVAEYLAAQMKRHPAKQVIDALVASDNLHATIREFEADLDSQLLERARKLSEQFQKKRQYEHAKKMIVMAAHIEAALMNRPPDFGTGKTPQSNILRLLLDAPDPLAVFMCFRNSVDKNLLSLVRIVAEVTRSFDHFEFAEGLDDLANCIEKTIKWDNSTEPVPTTPEAPGFRAGGASGTDCIPRLTSPLTESEAGRGIRKEVVASPKISIITPTYNCAQFIRTCIDSVLAQGYDNFEHLIVDGASKDNTVEILKSYPHIRWVSEPDDGEADALNKALRLVTGDIVCWLNADDWLLPGVFDRVVEEFSKIPGPCVVYGNTNMADEAGKFLVLKKSAPCITLQFLARWWMCPAHPHQPSMFFSKALMDDIGPFRQDLHFSVDYEYWLRAVVKYPFRCVDLTFSAARMRPDSKGLGTEAGQIESHWKVSLPYHAHFSPKEREEFWTEYYLHRLFERKDPEATRQPDCSEACIGLTLALLRAGKETDAFRDLFPDAGEQAAVRSTLCRLIPPAGDPRRVEVEKICRAIGAGLPVSDPLKTIPVLWSGPVFDPSGYSDQARNFIKRIGADWPLYLRPAGNLDKEFVFGLEQAEYRDLTERIKDPDRPYISLLSMPAYAFLRDPAALYNVGKTVFETDRLSPEWVSRCNAMDEVWVPTQFNVETFRQSGVKVPLVIVPEGVDPDFYRPGLEPLPIPGRRGFAFLSIFEWTYRKGWDLLLRAWAEAFSPGDDVCLILRASPVKGDKAKPHSIKDRVKAYYDSIGRPLDQVAPVIVMEDQVPQIHMPNLYAAADAFVLPSRGEGWGRPYIESMSCSLPVIGTRWGGNLEYMNRDNSYLIETNGREAVDEKMELPFYDGHCWSSPSPGHLKSLMKDVFSNREAARLKGQRARRDVIAHWTWKRSADLALSRIKDISATLRGKTISAPENGNLHTSSRTTFCLRWEGLQFVWHSMALINREVCIRLIDYGHELSILRYLPEEFGAEKDPRFQKLAHRVDAPLSRPADVHVRHHYPPDFNPPPEGRWVMIQPWEYGTLPDEWIEPMSTLVDQIWVPSRYVMKSYLASGIPSHLVRVVPSGVNTRIFSPKAQTLRLPTAKRFKFLFVGGVIWRKGLDILLQAYRQAFTKKDDVVLVIKEIGHSNYYQGMDSDNLIEEFGKDPGAPDILHLSEMLDEERMAGLFNACDCFVHSYRGEGFALPVLEAMSCGLPVIVTEGGPTDDFCSPETACLIPSTPRGFYSTRMKFVGGGPGWVLEPDPEILREMLRHAFENPDKMKENASRALPRVRDEFSLDKVAAKVIESIHQVMRKPIRRAI